MSKRAEKKQQDEEKILNCLASGPQTTAILAEVLSCSVRTANDKLNSLIRDGKVKKEKRRYFRIEASEPQDTPEVTENPRGEVENTETINKILNLYDTLLDTVALSIKDEDWKGVIEKVETIKSLRYLGATVDQLMKRWYLVHRGYDANTRQAQEDAKKKTAEREKQALENAPPEDQVIVIREYDETMRDVLATLPGKDLKERTV